MTVGDKVKRKICVFDPDRAKGGTASKVTVNATVTYIHPEKRYYTLRYTLPGGSYCESEYFAPRCGMARN